MIATALVGAALTALLWLEHRRPLRRDTERLLRRNARNLAMAALSATAIRCTERPVATPLAALVERKSWGLVQRLALPAWLGVLLSVVLLDYTLYIWHVLTHRVPFLWRFHRVHHADLDLSASTAIRFHFAEMVLSVPWRAAQVLAVGASPRALSIWQTATLLAILFHHSNVRLPAWVERCLCRLVVTPRMHGIHHSIVQEEADANWSTIFTWPDYLHRTYRLNVPQDAIAIGVPEYREPHELTLGRIVSMPFGPQRPFWVQPGGGKPARSSVTSPPSRLAK